MERVAPIRLVVYAIENGFVVADIVYRQELRRIEKVPRTNAVDGNEIPEFGGAPTEGARFRNRWRMSPRRLQGYRKGARLIRFRGGVYDQAGLVAVLGIRRSGNQFHVLDRVGGQLRGEDLALLIADRLAIHDEADLGVIAQG